MACVASVPKCASFPVLPGVSTVVVLVAAGILVVAVLVVGVVVVVVVIVLFSVLQVLPMGHLFMPSTHSSQILLAQGHPGLEELADETDVTIWRRAKAEGMP